MTYELVTRLPSGKERAQTFTAAREWATSKRRRVAATAH